MGAAPMSRVGLCSVMKNVVYAEDTSWSYSLVDFCLFLLYKTMSAVISSLTTKSDHSIWFD